MSKIIYICLRNEDTKIFDRIEEKIKDISKRILPDNISAREPKIIKCNGIIAGIFNPNDTIQIKNCSICLGFINETSNWQDPLLEPPEGTYALFRGNEKNVEVLSDVVASRTIWYFKNDDIFIASTSQRAIVYMIGKFELNTKIIPWMLSTGTLGPDIYGWDRRIKRLKGDSSLILERKSWTLTNKSKKVEFSPLSLPDQRYEELMKETLNETFSTINLDYKKWGLLLSGGYDSRGILCLLKKTLGLNTITWGTRKAILYKSNDAYIAKRLAELFNTNHHYFELDQCDESVEIILRRFVLCSEGRIDHISGYTDGLKTWKILYENDIYGIIRGDEGFGWSEVTIPSEKNVRTNIGLNMISDFSNISNLIKDYGLSKQELPEELKKRNDETFETWRDRLYHEFRIPVVLASLSDIKLSYVEIINPLLTKRIVYQTRRIPDNLRTEKRLYKSVINSISPSIPYAKHNAITNPKNFLKSKEAVSFLIKEISSEKFDEVFTKKFADYLISNINATSDSTNPTKIWEIFFDFVTYIFEIFPQSIQNIMKQIRDNTTDNLNMDFNILALRVYMIINMNKMLTEDASQTKIYSVVF